MWQAYLEIYDITFKILKGLWDPKHSCHIPKRGEQVSYMLPLLHPEDIDKLIKISSQEIKSSVCLSTHIADMCIPS